MWITFETDMTMARGPVDRLEAAPIARPTSNDFAWIYRRDSAEHFATVRNGTA
jgi:hypothetical protein